jgi:hypothetical protein
MRDDVTNPDCDATWTQVNSDDGLQIASFFDLRHALSISEHLGNLS